MQNVRVKQQNHVMLMIFCFNHSGKICGMGFDAAGAAQAANNIPTSVCTGNWYIFYRIIFDELFL